MVGLNCRYHDIYVTYFFYCLFHWQVQAWMFFSCTLCRKTERFVLAQTRPWLSMAFWPIPFWNYPTILRSGSKFQVIILASKEPTQPKCIFLCGQSKGFFLFSSPVVKTKKPRIIQLSWQHLSLCGVSSTEEFIYFGIKCQLRDIALWWQKKYVL